MNDINTLMQRIDEINAKSPMDLSTNDIDDIIAYHRRHRGRAAEGEKAQNPTADISDIRAALLGKTTTTTQTIKRRI